MKKHMRLTSILIALMLFVGIADCAFADMANFSPVRTYENGYFTDISENDWFYENVINAYEYGITQGAGDNKFLPHDLVSVAEVVAFGARIYSIYSGDEEAFAPKDNEKWYTPFYDYAIKNAIIMEGDNFNPVLNKPATRAQSAYILANSLPFTELSNINTNISSLPDVFVGDKYYNEIIMLYRAGVLSGKDEYGTFSPTENVTRAEVAAQICRVINPDTRLNVVFKEKTSQSPSSDEYSAENVSKIASPCVFYIEIYDRNGRAIGSGSGFFISSDGSAITNYHVIDEAYSAKIVTSSGDIHEVSSVLGYDKDRDIAIISVKGNNFPYLEIADSSQVKNGQKIFCIGSPLGLDNSISEGVVSNVSRTLNGQEFIQISAPISQGSSGGAVLDSNSHVVGISSAGFEDGQNVNLAIPSNYIAGVARDKNLSLAEFQQDKRKIAPSGAGKYYQDSFNVPDYGYVTGSSEIEGYRDEESDSIARAYIYNSNNLTKYISYIQDEGFSLVSKNQSGGFWSITTNLIYLNKDKNFIALSVDSDYVLVLYASK